MSVEAKDGISELANHSEVEMIARRPMPLNRCNEVIPNIDGDISGSNHAEPFLRLRSAAKTIDDRSGGKGASMMALSAYMLVPEYPA